MMRSARRAIGMSMRDISLWLPRTRLGELAAAHFKDVALSGQFWLTAFTLLAALLLGGGTRGGFLSDALLQFLAIPLLLLSVSRFGDLFWQHRAKLRQVRWEIAFCVAVVLVPLLQLVPLPPALWTLLPHREPLIASFDGLGRGLSGDGLPWLPISVSPNATWLSVAALLPTLAVFFGTILLGYRERRLLSLGVVAFGIVSSFLGLLQIAQGPASRLRFFSATNLTEAVGFFANRNHFAAFLYVVLLFAAVWAIDIGFAVGPWRDRRILEARSVVTITASFLAIVVLLAAEAMARSRAGMILTMVSLAGVYGLVLTDRRRRTLSATPLNFLFAAAGTAFILVMQFALYRVLARFNTDPLDDLRLQFARTTIEAAWAYMPFGAGMGTFVPVYAMFEKPQDLFSHAYINHAHDDILELWLETGIFGIALMGAFAAWFVSRAARIWRHGSVGANEFDRSLVRAATIAVALIVAHSFLDYPLRTAAMTAILAFACGLMVETLGANTGAKERRVRSSFDTAALGATPRVTAASPATASPPAVVADQEPAASYQPPRQRPARWGDDVEWPEAWRRGGAGPGAGPKKTPAQAPTPPSDSNKK
ncbi:MAG: O-antigen ligase family protein [Xanthobacteraceae bacterium]